MHRAPEQPAEVFAALGDEIRLKLVARLGDEGPLSIARLTVGTEVSRQAVSKHLHVLEGAEIVRSDRRGRECVWQLDRRKLDGARRYLNFVSNQWDERIGRLKKFVED